MRVVTSYLLGITGALGLAGVGRFLSYEGVSARKTEFDLGPVSELEPSASRLVPEIPAVVRRTQDGIEAISLACTHLGCTVDTTPQGFECPCHGSRFDMEGAVTRGPASEPLRKLRAEIADDGRLIVHADSE